ncbi:transcription initiation factor TFIID subunit 3 isoform X2 [Spea bombifrons]|uniref:transcription initiation factor TFIID subunit 3 isoform X2 n=1 Tax=Spea bombifrons TaxID=233779 RepID=UPI00234B74C6|nr:transcription initiation factor TFIID subunit 3 isoform X2 [Spea bombifrons]
MCESYSRSLLRVSVAQICQALGWDSVQLTACDLLTDVLHRYLQQLCRGAHRYSDLYGRTDPVLDDVGQAFKLMGVNLNELEDYIHNIEPVTFPHQIPSFPVSKNNVLQFPSLGNKDVEDRKEYIPDYLPLIVSSQEEEEEEQVPTDGGTSAEAMQVPLEEEGEMEEDETVNDENYLSKRPLSSPEQMEMPFAKRPRLANSKGDVLDGAMEPREPLSSINTQKGPISPSPVQDNADLVLNSSEPHMVPPVSKTQAAPSKTLDAKALTPKTKSKGGSPGQKTKSPKSNQAATVLGSPLRSPKSSLKEKKSPVRAKSPKSPKSPKVPVSNTPPPVKAETPSRTSLVALSEKIGKENIQIKQIQTPLDSERLNIENPSVKKPSVTDNTIEDSIDAVIARACAEQDSDPFDFTSGSESEGEVFPSPKKLTISEPVTPKVLASSSGLAKAASTPLPLSGGTSSSDISWTMDDSINEVIRKVNQETPSNIPVNPPCFSSPSASPPTPEPLLKVYEDKTKLASPLEVKKKPKKDLKTKMKKKEKVKDKEKERSKDKNRDKNKEKEKEKDGMKEAKALWKDRDDETEVPKFKLKEFNDLDIKSKQKENSGKKDKEKHKDKKKDKEKGKKDKEKKVKDKNKEEKLKSLPSTPILLSPKEITLPMISTPNPVRLPPLLSAMSPLLPEKLFEDKEKAKEKDKKKDKKEKKKKKDKEKVKEKDKKEKEKKEKDKDKHKHEKAKAELSVPAPSPVIPRLTLRVGAGQDTIVISKVVSAPEGKPSAPPSLPKSPPPAPSPAPAPVVAPPPVQAPAAASPAPNPAPAPSHPHPPPPPPPPPGPTTGNTKTPVRSVVTETVSTYVIRDEWGNQIWICPGCNKPDDGSPMIGCDGCDDWYHWPCVGIKDDPTELEQWFCKKCDSKKKDKKHKKRKHKAH